MNQNSLIEKYYQDLVDATNACFIQNDLEGCFRRLKDYIGKNYTNPEAKVKIDEIIHYQSANSRVDRDRRQGLIDYSVWNQEVNKITKSIQEFVKTLKPIGFEIDVEQIFENTESAYKNWNYDGNLMVTLVFAEGFGLLGQIFSAFVRAQKEQNAIRCNKYFFDGIHKILIDENRVESLNEEETHSVVTEYMEWLNAVIIQKKDNEGFVVSEALITKSLEKEEIKIRANGAFYPKNEILVDTVKWFQNNETYPIGMKEPFTVNVSFSSLVLFQFSLSK